MAAQFRLVLISTLIISIIGAYQNCGSSFESATSPSQSLICTGPGCDNNDTDTDGEVTISSPVTLSLIEGMQATIEVRLDRSYTDTIAFGWNLSSGSSDFQQSSGAISFAPGEISKNILISALDDMVYEGLESFFLQFNQTAGSTKILISPVKLEVRDNEEAPFVIIENAVAYEGSTAELRVRLTKISSLPVEINLATRTVVGATNASEGLDYTADLVTRLIIEPGQIETYLPVWLPTDGVTEQEEVVRFQIIGVTNAYLVSSSPFDAGNLWIIDMSKASTEINRAILSSAIGYETGETALRVALARPATQKTNISYAIKTTTQTSSGDLAIVNGSIQIPVGEQYQDILAYIYPDTRDEINEQYTVTIGSSNAAIATIDTREARGLILDDDLMPSLHKSPSSKTSTLEGGKIIFSFKLSEESGKAISFNYEVKPGTATSGADYLAPNGKINVTIRPGTLTIAITIATINDSVVETTNENFKLALSDLKNASLASDLAGEMTAIINTANDPVLSFIDNLPTDPAAFAGETEGREVAFNLALDKISNRDVRAFYHVKYLGGSTDAGDSDLIKSTGELFIPAGSLSGRILIPTIDDSLFEDPIEKFALEITLVSGAEIESPLIYGRIEDNDPAPNLIGSIQSSGIEGQNLHVVFSLNGVNQVGLPIDIMYSTEEAVASNSAMAGLDFPFLKDKLIRLPQGHGAVTLAIAIPDDGMDETFNEVFHIRWSVAVPNGILVSPDPLLATILSDPPVLSVNPGSAGIEGGTIMVNFNLSRPSDRPSTFKAKTRLSLSGTPATSNDFTRLLETTLTIPSGQSSLSLPISILDDAITEPSESFELLIFGFDNLKLVPQKKVLTMPLLIQASD